MKRVLFLLGTLFINVCCSINAAALSDAAKKQYVLELQKEKEAIRKSILSYTKFAIANVASTVFKSEITLIFPTASNTPLLSSSNLDATIALEEADTRWLKNALDRYHRSAKKIVFSYLEGPKTDSLTDPSCVFRPITPELPTPSTTTIRIPARRTLPPRARRSVLNPQAKVFVSAAAAAAAQDGH